MVFLPLMRPLCSAYAPALPTPLPPRALASGGEGLGVGAKTSTHFLSPRQQAPHPGAFGAAPPRRFAGEGRSSVATSFQFSFSRGAVVPCFEARPSAELLSMTAQRSSRDLHIFEVAGLVVDADLGRGDPAG